MDKAAARQWKERWALVEQAQDNERQGYGTEERWRQLMAIVRLAQRYGMVAGGTGEADVWSRWAKLKEAMANEPRAAAGRLEQTTVVGFGKPTRYEHKDAIVFLLDKAQVAKPRDEDSSSATLFL